MKQKILTYYFAISILIGSLIYIAQKLIIKLPTLVNNYVNDFLIIPIILTICLYILRWSKNNKHYQIPLGVMVYICALYSFFFEFIIPKYMERYTADIFDVILYFIGGFVFLILQEKEINS
ncbi:hypothetical protein KUL156_07850 [Alteromonas sp. KUL156]|uniref:Magnesium citrate secondary transporter n=1 Tax=Tenacibaculum sp. Pbs-1 TaxID=3238748 RepID=A0AB33KZ37_9FLAO|nr:hypothetical protein KUL113_54200 [Tenacibaculum sp. KUL113]GFD93934.1 hypothetical protein KUL154_26670 [Alteromonas sp. KUL154]GFD98192.1 hypothetical protein KUL156_07850 [Alteromonas sp. KUL156]